MGDQKLSFPVQSPLDPPLIMRALEERLMIFGGEISRDPGNYRFIIEEGKEGVPGGFLMKLTVDVRLVRKGPIEYVVDCTVTKQPSVIFWCFLVPGLILYPLLIANGYYLTLEPEREYAKRLQNIQFELETISRNMARSGAPPQNYQQVSGRTY